MHPSDRSALFTRFSAWRTWRVGTREVTDALLPPGAGSGELQALLAEWPGAWYWADRSRARLILIRPILERRPRWVLHGLLLLATLLCVLGAGAILEGSITITPAQGLAGLLSGMGGFFRRLVAGDWRVLLQGWSFALPLLGILAVHELGHYFAARRYALDVSPPWFIPVPPTLSPIGSLGAFIRVRSAVLDRRQLLDVGAAGPIAGFVVALAVLWWGYAGSERIAIVAGAPSYVTLGGHPVFLGESLLTGWLRNLLVPGTGPVHLSSPAFAGWVGMFITGLNLLPLSQLDGGHVLYGVLGRYQAAVAIGAVAGLLWLAQGSPTWYVWVAFALVIGGGRFTHPKVMAPGLPVPWSRKLIGLAAALLLVLTFVPRPFGG